MKNISVIILKDAITIQSLQYLLNMYGFTNVIVICHFKATMK